jgi:hypothetical protein
MGWCVCRYMAFGAVTKLAEKYDWLWRLAPDGVLTENITSDPFVALASTGKRSVTHTPSCEPHAFDLCVVSTWFDSLSLAGGH